MMEGDDHCRIMAMHGDPARLLFFWPRVPWSRMQYDMFASTLQWKRKEGPADASGSSRTL